MNWQVACITAPRATPTLNHTLDSLAAAGWPDVVVYSDRETPPRGCYWNWRRAMADVLKRIDTIDDSPILICEDDCEFYSETREYYEAYHPPTREAFIASLYTAAPNHLENSPGWNQIPMMYGKPIRTYGALALVIPCYLLPELVGNPVRRDDAYGTDHAIGAWCRREGVEFWTHSPSFVRHTGEHTTLADAGVGVNRQCAVWKGDEVAYQGDGVS